MKSMTDPAVSLQVTVIVGGDVSVPVAACRTGQ